MAWVADRKVAVIGGLLVGLGFFAIGTAAVTASSDTACGRQQSLCPAITPLTQPDGCGRYHQRLFPALVPDQFDSISSMDSGLSVDHGDGLLLAPVC